MIHNLVFIHLGVYVALFCLFALLLHNKSVRLYKDDRHQLLFWERRLPAMAFWLLAWEVTLPLTPWFYKRLVAGNQHVKIFAISVCVFLATIVFTWLIMAYADKQAVYLSPPPPMV